MAATAINPEQVAQEQLCQQDTLADRFMEWVRTELIWYAGSFTFHLLLLSSLLLLGNVAAKAIHGDGPGFEPAEIPEQAANDPPPLEPFDPGETPLEPTEITTASLIERPTMAKQTEEYNNDDAVFEHRGGGTANSSKDPTLGGLGSFSMLAYGPGTRIAGSGGVSGGLGTGTLSGSGGDGAGFGARGRGWRRAQLGGQGTKPSERAVAAALHWLYRHQLSDGSWSLDHKQRCIDQTCTGCGQAKADAGATALGVLPFLAAGQTHKTVGPYRDCVKNALVWLLRHQERDGNLAKGCVQPMYSHGLATIALCEAYGLSGDHVIGAAAQQAVDYIVAAQNKTDFGWRYNPGDPGDTSVVGWQVMALKSASMAGLNVGGSSSSTELACKWFDLVKCGPNGCNFQYQPNSGPTPAMSAVGLLCRQYMGAKRNDPMMLDGVQYLMKNMPDVRMHNIYYWYYATQVMHNYSGYEWDTWNRAMRKLLINTQCRDKNTCASGSWDPNNPGKDAWGSPGGRHMVTCLSCLTLEVYYRLSPLYKFAPADGAGAAPARRRRPRTPGNNLSANGDSNDRASGPCGAEDEDMPSCGDSRGVQGQKEVVMDEAANNPEHIGAKKQRQDDTLADRFMEWGRTDLIWCAGSFAFNLLLLCSLLLLGNVAGKAIQGDGGEAETAGGGGVATGPATDVHLGGLGGFNVLAYGGGAKVTGTRSVGAGPPAGSGGNSTGFGRRDSGHRRAQLGSAGGTKTGERAVAGALHWLYRHQNSDGHWSLDHKLANRCSDQSCIGAGQAKADAGATALGLLPFLAAGQTHKTNGPYRTTIQNALHWLLRHQEGDGNLAKRCEQPMCSHGLATIALCEAYGLTNDHNIGAAAQAAVNYIVAAQNKTDFGWRYSPGDPSDTSVTGWQVMALKSALMAGLNVDGSGADLACKWFDLVKCGPNGCNFQYQPTSGPTPAMTAVGLLCRQYMAKRNDPMMLDGVKYLMKNMPDVRIHNVYYWYYATQVMHNYAGYEWDTWNRAMRKLLISTQTARGSAPTAVGTRTIRARTSGARRAAVTW